MITRYEKYPKQPKRKELTHLPGYEKTASLVIKQTIQRVAKRTRITPMVSPVQTDCLFSFDFSLVFLPDAFKIPPLITYKIIASIIIAKVSDFYNAFQQNFLIFFNKISPP